MRWGGGAEKECHGMRCGDDARFLLRGLTVGQGHQGLVQRRWSREMLQAGGRRGCVALAIAYAKRLIEYLTIVDMYRRHLAAMDLRTLDGTCDHTAGRGGLDPFQNLLCRWSSQGSRLENYHYLCRMQRLQQGLVQVQCLLDVLPPRPLL